CAAVNLSQRRQTRSASAGIRLRRMGCPPTPGKENPPATAVRRSCAVTCERGVVLCLPGRGGAGERWLSLAVLQDGRAIPQTLPHPPDDSSRPAGAACWRCASPGKTRSQAWPDPPTADRPRREPSPYAPRRYEILG